MADDFQSSGGGKPPVTSTLLLVVLAIAIPFVVVKLRAQVRPTTAMIVPGGEGSTMWDGVAGHRYPKSPHQFNRQTVGPAPKHRPRISNVQIIDFDEDGINDVIACDCQSNQVILYRQTKDGEWEERILGRDLLAPAHATVSDIDGDGDRDVIVSILGNIYPDDTVIGRVVLLENRDGKFTQRILLDDVRRVADVQVGDMDGDGDLDMVAAVFGYRRGEVLWLENHGKLRFEQHTMLYAAGTIHVPIADYDGDGDLDVATVVSQEDEEAVVIENLGDGKFKYRRIWSTINYDIGSAGMVKSDLDGDGDMDLLLPVGDNFEDLYSTPRPYHGCIWLENLGGLKFKAKTIATFSGTYAAAVGDIDGDKDKDVVLVSMFNAFEIDGNASVVWLENDGEQNFRTWQLADNPIQLITVDSGDLNGDGLDDVVAGGFHVPRPFVKLGRITAWTSRK